MGPKPVLPNEKRERIRGLLYSTYFANSPRDHLEGTEIGRFVVDQHVWQRYEQALYGLAPWAHKAGGLSGKRVVEIGCGTGSSTAGFAAFASEVHGYEIDHPSVDAARGRFEILGIKNAEAHQVDGEQMVATIIERHRGKVDAFLLYAVLEHMTIPERLQVLSSTVDALPSGGLLVIIETPNRLTYTDRHTSYMPFFHMLPQELAASYYMHSKRIDFVQAIDRLPKETRPMALTRWGNGVSFHEFDVALGVQVDPYIIADGFEPEVTGIYPICIDDELLLRYFETANVGRHRAFTRNHLNFILRKP